MRFKLKCTIVMRMYVFQTRGFVTAIWKHTVELLVKSFNSTITSLYTFLYEILLYLSSISSVHLETEQRTLLCLVMIMNYDYCLLVIKLVKWFFVTESKLMCLVMWNRDGMDEHKALISVYLCFSYSIFSCSWSWLKFRVIVYILYTYTNISR